MRVFLPFHNQKEGQEDDDEENEQQVLLGSPENLALTTTSNYTRQELAQLSTEFDSKPRAVDTTTSEQVESSQDSLPPPCQDRKRKADDNDLERKPAAKPKTAFQDSKQPAVASKMTAGRYDDDTEERDQPEQEEVPQENDPAAPYGRTPLTLNRNNVVIEQDEIDPEFDANAVCDNVASSEFATELRKRGLEIREQEGDGNCLFRAVALQIYGDASMHGQIRQQCLDFMAKDEAHFTHFVTGESFKDYIARKRKDGVHGNNPEIQAISELFNRPVELFTPENGATPLNIFQTEYKTSDVPIRLSYHDGTHYNAVVDPLVPTAGLGLGLPDLKPGLADQLQLSAAITESDKAQDQMELKRAIEESHGDEMQRALKESTLAAARASSDKALALSDVDATNFELEQAILESSMETYRQDEGSRKQRAIPTSAKKAEPQAETRNDVSASISSTSASLPPVAPVASIPPAASVPAAASLHDRAPSPATLPRSADEYPQTVQELVMNGFELSKVVKAYELIGDSFDDLLSYLISTNT